jgi:hypothetical protein
MRSAYCKIMTPVDLEFLLGNSLCIIMRTTYY